MRQRLFPNIKRMTNLFCAGIILVTAVTLASRLTFLSELAPPASGMTQIGSVGPQTDASQTDYLINTKIHFSSPEAKGNVLITNTEQNANYIRVDITLNSTGKSVYYSGDIAPGTTIGSARLQGDPLKEGVYECTASITAYDPATKDKMGQENVAVTLYVGVKPEK